MLNFRCVFNSASTLCRQLLNPLNVNGTAAQCGVRRLPLQRPLFLSAVRHQEAEASTGKDFSHFPPMPGQDSPLRWAGKKFEELPIIHIKATYNKDRADHLWNQRRWPPDSCLTNLRKLRQIFGYCTHIQLTDSAGQSLVRTSCGTEGFKNSKKSTPIAAQTAGISAAAKATVKGVTFVRVVVKGLGPGRQSAIKGLTMGGLQVVSITDNTPVPHNGCRPRKARRI